MSDLNDAPGNGSKFPVLPVLLVFLSAAVGALTTWGVRIEDRLYALIRDVPTRQEIQSLRTDLTGRLDRIEANLTTVLARPQLPLHP